MSTRPQKASTSDGGNKKHRPAPYNKNVKPKGGSGGAGGQSNASGLPGVSKIKSQIRQTTRLLSKVSSSVCSDSSAANAQAVLFNVQDNLAPALRVQTERRLTSLQADLAKAEHRTVERKNGERYHMVSLEVIASSRSR